MRKLPTPCSLSPSRSPHRTIHQLFALVAFKTDRIKIEDVDKRTEEYLVQLGLYQAGMQMALGKPPQVIIYYLFPGVPIEIDGDALLEARAKVHNLFSELSG